MISCPSSNEDLVLRDGQGFQHSRRSIFFLSLCQRIDASVYHRSREREVSWAGRPGDDNRLCVYRIINAVLLFWKKKRIFFQTPKVVFWPWWRPPLSFIYRSPWRRSAHTLDTKRARLPLLLSPFFFSLFFSRQCLSLSLLLSERPGPKGSTATRWRRDANDAILPISNSTSAF